MLVLRRRRRQATQRRQRQEVSPLLFLVVLSLHVVGAYSSYSTSSHSKLPRAILKQQQQQPQQQPALSATTTRSTQGGSIASSSNPKGTTNFFPWPLQQPSIVTNTLAKEAVSKAAVPVHVPAASSSKHDDGDYQRRFLLFSSPPEEQVVKSFMTFSFLAMSGVVEAICYRYYKCFPNLMTGTTVRFLDSMVDFRWMDAACSGSMILLYVVGNMLYKLLEIMYYYSSSSSPQQEQQQQQEQHPHYLSPQHKKNLQLSATLWRTTQLTMLAFGLSDWVEHRGRLLVPHPAAHSSAISIAAAASWRVPLLSLGFGMIHAASMDVLGVVTNAVTGHWSKVGLGLAESSLMAAMTFTSTTSNNNNNNKGNGSSSSSSSIKKNNAAFQTSAWGLTIFSVSFMATSALMRVVEAKKNQKSPLSLALSFLPPLGVSLGAVYGALFMGYSRYLLRPSSSSASSTSSTSSTSSPAQPKESSYR